MTVRSSGADSTPTRMSELQCRRFGCPNIFTGGQSAQVVQTIRPSLKFFSLRHKCFWWVSKVELRTVRPLGPNSPPAQASELHSKRFGCTNVFKCGRFALVIPTVHQPLTGLVRDVFFSGVFFSITCFNNFFKRTFKFPYQIHSTHFIFNASMKNIPLFHAVFVQIQFVSI